MKNILFRAKRTDNGKWVYGYYLPWHAVTDVSGNEPYAKIFEEYKKNGKYIAKGWANVLFDTVSQYIGLKDKNGNEIFEGDILKCYSPDGGNYVFCSVGFGECEDDEEDVLYAIYLNLNGEKKILYPQYNQYEVVGNIWDNSELLKEVK